MFAASDARKRALVTKELTLVLEDLSDGPVGLVVNLCTGSTTLTLCGIARGSMLVELLERDALARKFLPSAKAGRGSGIWITEFNCPYSRTQESQCAMATPPSTIPLEPEPLPSSWLCARWMWGG